MDKLCHMSGFHNCDILNEVTAKAKKGNKQVIIKLGDYNQSVKPYIAIQNKGGSGFVIRVLSFTHYYLDELPNELIHSLNNSRKDNLLQEDSLYLKEMEYIEGFPFWDYYEKQDSLGVITPKNLTKLIKETFSGLSVIHNAGYFHGDLGMSDNILLEGSYDRWKRAVIIDVEGGKIKTNQATIDDVLTLAYVIWSVLVGDISLTEDKHREIIGEGHDLFIQLVEDNMRQFKSYKKSLEILLWIFKSNPTPTANMVADIA